MLSLSSHQPPCLPVNVRGHLIDLSEPCVMGIVNATPDSFYAGSRSRTSDAVVTRTGQLLAEGAMIIDLGAYSTRPGAGDISPDEEMRRLTPALEAIRLRFPEAILSIDTFRADVARRCVTDFGVDIINDISGGELDGNMFETVADLHVPYILTHMRGTPQTMQQDTHYDDLMSEVCRWLAERVERLHEMGVADIIIDPGFGFSKTLQQNYEMMRRLSDLHILGKPLLVGISRKSMIYRLLGTSPEEALNGTTVLNTVALLSGASILRVHDARAATEAIKIVKELNDSQQP